VKNVAFWQTLSNAQQRSATLSNAQQRSAMATRLWLSGAVAPPIALGEAMAAMVGSNFVANLSCERIGRFEWIYIYIYMILI